MCRAPSCPRRHGRRGAPSGAPAAVLRTGIDSWDVVDHVGAIRLAGDSPSARFGRPVMAAPPYPYSVSLTSGAWLSVRERENSEILLFLNLNSAVTLEIYKKIIIAPKILKNCV